MFNVIDIQVSFIISLFSNQAQIISKKKYWKEIKGKTFIRIKNPNDAIFKPDYALEIRKR